MEIIMSFSPTYGCWKIVKTVKQISDMINKKELNPDPVGQRPPLFTTIGSKKDRGIISAIMIGLGIGSLTLRDITETTEEKVKKMYVGYDSLVIDGGHRCRAINNFRDNKFTVTVCGVEKYYREFTDAERKHFDNFEVTLDYIKCTSLAAIDAFKIVNQTTSANGYELIMNNDSSVLCEEVRKITKSYPEYNFNKCHPIFEIRTSDQGQPESVYFSSINERAIWHTWVWVILHKILNGGHVDAGEKKTIRMIEKEDSVVITKKHRSDMARFFDDLMNFGNVYGKKLRDSDFGAFQCVWFHLYAQNKAFKIDMEKFVKPFDQVRSALTGTVDKTLDNATIPYKNETHAIKHFVRVNDGAYSESDVQEEVGKIILQYMKKKGTLAKLGITLLQSKRSYSLNQRHQVYNHQGGNCWACEKSVKLENTEWAHDTPYSEGGLVEDGVVLCKACHSTQGQLTHQELKSLLDSRKKASLKVVRKAA